MKRKEALCSVPGAAAQGGRRHRPHEYQKALDVRKHPIRGIWLRNGFYIARLNVSPAGTGKPRPTWVTLTDPLGGKISSFAEARAALEKLRTQRIEEDLPVTGRGPTLRDYIPEYLKHRETLTGADAKRPATLAKDKSLLARWSESVGHLRLNQIKSAHIVRYRDELLRGGNGNRSANLAVIILRGLCKHAKLEGYIKTLPMQDLQKLRESPPKRAFVTAEDNDKLCHAACETLFY